MTKSRTPRQQLSDINRMRTAGARQRPLTLDEAVVAGLINADGSPVDWDAYEDKIATVQQGLEPEQG